MAKVKGQVYDGSEESYTDHDGRVHSFGEFIRWIMPDAYPVPWLTDEDIARKTPRGYKPPQQGPGAAAQAMWRQCFQQCANRWNAMPDACPPYGGCFLRSSKQNVWAAKQLQGVMCSYYDLWMDCCLSSCTEISITGPDGVAVTGGVISADDNCWPCPSPCRDSELIIGYTTQHMLVGQTQALHAHDSFFGDSVPCCRENELRWEIVSGGGELSADVGASVFYKAPDSNGDCVQNPTIQLTDCCNRFATLALSVNEYGIDPAVEAIRRWTEVYCCELYWEGCPTCDPPYEPIYYGLADVTKWNCFNDQIYYCHTNTTATGATACATWADWLDCYLGSWPCDEVKNLEDVYVDTRNDFWKIHGCCPLGLEYE